MNAHTPGHWRIVKRPEQGTTNGRRITVEGKGAIVADLDWNTPAENQANACLITIAPDLLDFALKVSRSACLQQRVSDQCICFVCEAQRLIEKYQAPVQAST